MNIFLRIIKVCVILLFVLSCKGDRQLSEKNDKTSDVDEKHNIGEKHNKMSENKELRIRINFDEQLKLKSQRFTVSSTDAKNEIFKWLEKNTKVDQRFESLAMLPIVSLRFKDKSISVFCEENEIENASRNILSFFNKFLIEGNASSQVIQTSSKLEEYRVYFTTKEN